MRRGKAGIRGFGVDGRGFEIGRRIAALSGTREVEERRLSARGVGRGNGASAWSKMPSFLQSSIKEETFVQICGLGVDDRRWSIMRFCNFFF